KSKYFLEINECASEPCKNNGSCLDEINGYVCRCTDGYDGIHCEKDINECEFSQCENNGTCVDKINDFACECPDGVTGTYCENDIDECDSGIHECDRINGLCVNTMGSYSCECSGGYVLDGTLCVEPSPDFIQAANKN
uniref:fibropellin-3-like n=1 Tax=Styela clava TaxID=7725 RepID=UPI0019397EDF